MDASDAQIERLVDSKRTNRLYRDGANLENEADVQTGKRKEIRLQTTLVQLMQRFAQLHLRRDVVCRVSKCRTGERLGPESIHRCSRKRIGRAYIGAALACRELTRPLSPAASFHNIRLLLVVYTSLVKREADGTKRGEGSECGGENGDFRKRG
jgi:hypothetical protein